MKKGLILLMTVLISSLSLAFVGCDGGGGGGGNPPPVAKSLVVTGLATATNLDKGDVVVLLVNESGFIVGGRLPKSDSITFKLYVNGNEEGIDFNTGTSPEWTGSGSYYIGLFPAQGSVVFDPGYMTKQKVSFNGATTNITFNLSTFEEFYF